jgi:hypothetical protein
MLSVKLYVPWKLLKRSKLDLLLATANVLGSFVRGVITMVRCGARTSLGYVLIALWKLLFSLSVAMAGLIQSVGLIRHMDFEDRGNTVLLCVALFGIASLLGWIRHRTRLFVA